MNIKKVTGQITKVVDLSKTTKEVYVKLSEPVEFLPGGFFNVFLDINGEVVRKAFSISSSVNDNELITFTIRLSPQGTLTPYLWSHDILGTRIELMGPLGLNTVDKMHHEKIYLFAFGVGVGVVKSIADYFSNIKKVKSLTVITGSRSEEEILYKEYFASLAENSENISILNVVSNREEGSTVPKGYIQDYIDNFDFNESDVYVCGQEKACSDLVAKVSFMNPKDCSFFIESFH